MAETIAQLRVKGISKVAIFEGIHFPVESGYVAITMIGKETAGLLLGPINVGGQIYNVSFQK